MVSELCFKVRKAESMEDHRFRFLSFQMPSFQGIYSLDQRPQSSKPCGLWLPPPVLWRHEPELHSCTYRILMGMVEIKASVHCTTPAL